MISKNKIRIQVTLDKRLDSYINELVEKSKETESPITKSQVIETSIRYFIDVISQAKSKED